jgi:hypothetical protein
MTCAGLGIPDSRPSHASSSPRSATVNRPSRLTGIPAFAHLWAVAELKPRNLAMAAHPFSGSDVFGFGLAMEGECNSFWSRVPDARRLAAQSGRNQIHRWIRYAHHDLVVVVTLWRRGVAGPPTAVAIQFRNQIHGWIRYAHHDLVVVVTLCRREWLGRQLLWRHNFETKYIDGFAALTMTSRFLDALVEGSNRS